MINRRKTRDKTRRVFLRKKGWEDPGMIWLTTFNDLITLMMVFFVLLFSMSSLDIRKLLEVKLALQSALGVLDPGAETSVSVVDEELNSAKKDPLEHEAKVKEESRLKALNEKMGVGASFSRQRVFITLENHLLFEVGKADLSEKGYGALDGILPFLKVSKKNIRVEGHTDSVPIISEKYPSNWELSTARAVSVIKYFIEKGILPQRLSAIGYADLKPIAENNSRNNRALNRRVEIVMEL